MQESIQYLTAWHWVGFAILLTILEVTIGTSFFLLWTGGCSILVAIVIGFLPHLSWEYQLVIFASATITSILFWNWHLKHNPAVSDAPKLNRRSELYIGRVFTLNEPIVNGRGKIQVDDSFWRIEGEDLPVGTKVEVISVDGVVLKILALQTVIVSK